VQLKKIHLEYLLPIGYIPPRDIEISEVLGPGAETCLRFTILTAEELTQMIQDPLSFPPLPFTLNSRVAVMGRTMPGAAETAVAVEASGDLSVAFSR